MTTRAVRSLPAPLPRAAACRLDLQLALFRRDLGVAKSTTTREVKGASVW